MILLYKDACNMPAFITSNYVSMLIRKSVNSRLNEHYRDKITFQDSPNRGTNDP